MSKSGLCPLDDDNAWDAFVRTSPQGTPFMLSAMLKACAHQVERWALIDNGQPQACVAVLFDDHGRVQAPPPYMLYQGMMLAPASERKPGGRATANFRLTETFLALLAERFERIELHQHWAFEDLRPFQWFNYHEPDKGQFTLRLVYTGLLDLTPYADFQEYLGDVRTLRRREYKKTLSDIVFEDSDDVDMLVDLHTKTYGRQGIALDADLVGYRKRIVRSGLENGFGTLKRAVAKDGAVASMIYFLEMNDTAYYLFGANAPEHRAGGASTGLMLNMIEDALGRGISKIDFCGINSPTRGDYKISLGATPRPYFLLSYQRR